VTLPIFYKYYKSVNNEQNIVYNSVIIANTLWLMNSYKMQYAELVASVAVLMSLGASLHRVTKTDIFKFEEQRRYRALLIILDVVNCGILAFHGFLTERYSFIVEAFSHLVVFIFTIFWIRKLEKECKLK